MLSKRRHARLRSRQSGAALLVFAALLVLISASALLDRLATRAQVNTGRTLVAVDSLAKAKAALIAYAVTDANRPGELPCPDVDYDGTLTLGVDFGGGGACTSLRGWLPWRSLGIGDLRDSTNERIWYSLSNTYRAGGAAALNPDTAGDLSVDATTNLVAVLIAPGRVFTGAPDQTARPAEDAGGRDAAAEAALYLEGVNADADLTTYTAAGAGNFNDQIAFIRRDELMRQVEKRVLGDAAIRLEQYRATYGRYPWLSPFRDPRSVTGTATGGSGTTLVDANRVDTPGDPSVDHFSDSGVGVDYLVLNLTDGSSGRVSVAAGANTVTFTGGLSGGTDNDFDPGDLYEIRPPFNGAWNMRAGHVPYVDLGNNESFDAFPTGFTATWTGAGPTTCADPVPGLVQLTGASCALVNASLAAAAAGPTTATVQPPAAGDGQCDWNDSAATANPERNVDCRGTSSGPAGYSVDLCLNPLFFPPGCPTVWATVPVTRTYTFNFNYTGGAAATSTTNGVKSRDVTNNPGGQTVTIQDRVAGLPVGSVVTTIPANQLTMSGIYYDILDNGDANLDIGTETFDPYFFANGWHRFIYAGIAAADVSGGGGDCVAAGNCLTLDVDPGSGVLNGVRNDVRLVLAGSGADLGAGAVPAQDRNADDGAANITLSDYFELDNNDADATIIRGTRTVSFNDQLRLCGNLPPPVPPQTCSSDR